MKWRSYFRCAFLTTLNVLIYAITFGHFIWLEGRVSGGKFRNWAKRYIYTPVNFAQPTTETEIIELVRNFSHLRVFGAGHSFNAGNKSDETLISLDKFSGLNSKELTKKQMTFKAGTRVRDVIHTLRVDGLAFAALPSHDAQSLGGILSTDVHGTGRDWGFVSESVVKLRIIDGNGDTFECEPEDDLFKAAIGGVGAVGIITEVTLQAVDRFNVEQKTWKSDLTYVENNLNQLIQENDHISLYISPYTNKCLVNTWNRTDKKISTLGGLREFLVISADALLAGWLGNLLAYTGLLPSLSSLGYSLKKGTSLVLESNAAFNRSIYHLHQELEFAVPFEDSVATWRRFIELYESLYPQGLPYLLIEVRFTPAGHDRTLIGPGRDRRSTWIDLICNDTAGFEIYYRTAEAELKQIDARPHLGKYCESCDRNLLAQLHQEKFTRFCQLREEHDPQGKFVNPFIDQLFRG
jgi:hypothetical protein